MARNFKSLTLAPNNQNQLEESVYSQNTGRLPVRTQIVGIESANRFIFFQDQPNFDSLVLKAKASLIKQRRFKNQRN